MSSLIALFGLEPGRPGLTPPGSPSSGNHEEAPRSDQHRHATGHPPREPGGQTTYASRLRVIILLAIVSWLAVATIVAGALNS